MKSRSKGGKQAGRRESSQGGKGKNMIRLTPQVRQNIKNTGKIIRAANRAIDQSGSEYEPFRDISSVRVSSESS